MNTTERYRAVVRALVSQDYVVARDCEASSRYFYSVLEMPEKPWLPKYYVNRNGETWCGYRLVEAFRVPDHELDRWIEGMTNAEAQ